MRRGFEVDLVLAAAEGPRLPEVSPDVRIVDLRARRVLTSLPRLIAYLRREEPLALISYLDHANVIALTACRLVRYRGRVVVVEQNTLSEAAKHGKSRRDRLMPQIVRVAYPRADYVVGVSSGVVDDLARFTSLPAEKLKVVFNPIVTPDLKERAKEPVEHPWFTRWQQGLRCRRSAAASEGFPHAAPGLQSSTGRAACSTPHPRRGARALGIGGIGSRAGHRR